MTDHDAKARELLESLRWYGPAPGAPDDARHTALHADIGRIAQALRSERDEAIEELASVLADALDLIDGLAEQLDDDRLATKWGLKERREGIAAAIRAAKDQK